MFEKFQISSIIQFYEYKYIPLLYMLIWAESWEPVEEWRGPPRRRPWCLSGEWEGEGGVVSM